MECILTTQTVVVFGFVQNITSIVLPKSVYKEKERVPITSKFHYNNKYTFNHTHTTAMSGTANENLISINKINSPRKMKAKNVVLYVWGIGM